MKRCYKCGDEKPREDFYKDRSRKDGLNAICKPCHRSRYTPEQIRNHNLKIAYGVTAEEFDQKLAEQGGRCAICGTTDTSRSRHGRFTVDHDHASGDVRGILCGPCNMAIGLLQDNPDTLLAAAAYLLSYQDVLEALDG